MFSTNYVWCSLVCGILISGCSVGGTLLTAYAVTHPIDTVTAISKIPDENRRRSLFLSAISRCEEEIKTIPTNFRIDEFSDEAAALRQDFLLELLSTRKVKFIDVRLAEVKDTASRRRIAYPVGDEGAWFAPQGISSKYVRISLAKEGNSLCAPYEGLPTDTRVRIHHPPFLVDTCLATEYRETSGARYEFSYQKTVHPLGENFGYWSLRDRSAGTTIASLTTVDNPTRPLSGGDCRSPYALLIRRVEPLNDAEMPSQVVREISVTPTLMPDEVLANLGHIPQVSTIGTTELYTKEEERIVFHSHIYDEGWAAAIADAKKIGFGNYGERLLNWKDRTLIKLNVQAKYGYWYVRAADRGFYVFPGNWEKAKNNLLVRYDLNGKFEWAILVKPPKTPPDAPLCGIGPYSVQASANTLSLEGMCGDLTWDEQKSTKKWMRGTKLTISRSELPM